MINSMQSFLKNIIEFIELLRNSGMKVSISESMDAVNALGHVDMLSKEAVRTALSACLAKSPEDTKIFSEAFEKFFISKDARNERIESVIRSIEQKKLELDKAARELKFKDEAIKLDNRLKEVYASLPENEKQSIRDFLDKTATGKNVGNDFKPVVESLVSGKLRNMMSKYPVSYSNMDGMYQNIGTEAGVLAGEVIGALRREDELLNKNPGEISDAEMPAVVQLIEDMAKRLAARMERLKKNYGKRTRPDFGKTIRYSLPTGGVPFKLKYKLKSKKKLNYIILCDVSASMHRFSGFVLQFIKEMQKTLQNSECYVFSQDVEYINVNSFTNAIGFEQMIINSPVWRKGTDLGRALDYIMEQSGANLNSSSIVIIVSDGKTINADKAEKHLKSLSLSVKKIIWLNPIAEREWGKTPAVEKYRAVCSMLDCSTFHKLSEAISRI